MIDTHTHLNFKAFENDWREVVERANKAGVEKMIVVGTNLELSRRAVELSQQHPALYAAVGIHPHHAQEFSIINDQSSNNFQDLNNQIKEQMYELGELAGQPKVVAIGEVGLDKHEYTATSYKPQATREEKQLLFELQKQLFVEQVRLAGKVDKPLIIHSREVGDEVLEILKTLNKEKTSPSPSLVRRGKIWGVFHCFEGSKKYVRRILEAGFYVSFTGNVTYEQGRLGVAGEVPLERLLLETDSPLITPEPLRGQRNEPINVRLIAEAHAKARKVKVDIIDEGTSANAEALFQLTNRG